MEIMGLSLGRASCVKEEWAFLLAISKSTSLNHISAWLKTEENNIGRTLCITCAQNYFKYCCILGNSLRLRNEFSTGSCAEISLGQEHLF